MKIVFMGTPDFAVGALENIIKAGHEVTCVVTQPDKPKGRSDKLVPCPVKECALAHGLNVFQPEKIRKPEAVAELKKYPADIYVVAAFGQILTKEILEYPKYGCVNIHASILPKYRGAAPIQRAIIDGEKETGVTIMQMDEGIDTGDILMCRRTVIDDEETGGELFDRLAAIGAELIVEALPLIESGAIESVPQNEAESTHVPMLKKSDGRIDWSKSAVVIKNLVRGCAPWPGTFTFLEGKNLKIWRVDVADAADDKGSTAGEITVEDSRMFVKCGEGTLEIKELQLEGKKRMDAGSFLRGYAIKSDSCLKTEAKC